MNRIDRVTAILIQLQSRKVVKARDIADRFGVSLRTVYRDIRTLEEAGIPLLGEAGIGYSIMEGYRLPPVMFTKEEATAFLTAEKMIEKLADHSSGESYRSAMYKVRAVLRSADKDFLENIDDQIEVFRSRGKENSRLAGHSIQTILKGIGSRTVLSMSYFAISSQQQSSRDIEPIGIFYQENNWYLVAYCRLRKDYRDFRVDRISTIQLTGQVFDAAHPNLKTYLKQKKKEKSLHAVVIRVDKNICPYLNEQKYYNGFVSEREVKDRVEMTFLTASLEGFSRWYLMFGDRAEIISPMSLKLRVRAYAEATLRSL